MQQGQRDEASELKVSEFSYKDRWKSSWWIRRSKDTSMVNEYTLMPKNWYIKKWRKSNLYISVIYFILIEVRRYKESLSVNDKKE